MQLQQFSAMIWTAEYPLRIFGLEIGARMTVVDYTGHGDLWVHSPVKPSESLTDELKKLGEVRYVVAPNRWHHLFAASFQRAFPEAKLYCAPGLEKKRGDIVFDGILAKDGQYPWSGALSHTLLSGTPLLNEVVFLHRSSETLIVTDLGLHICEDSNLFTQMIFTMMGSYKRFGWNWFEKKLFIKDPGLFGESVDEILGWDFEKIIMAHGRLVSGNGKEKFRQAFT